MVGCAFMSAERALACAALSPLSTAPLKLTKATADISAIVISIGSPFFSLSFRMAAGAFSISPAVRRDFFVAFSSVNSLEIPARESASCNSPFMLRVIGKPTITADVTEGVKLALGHHLLGALAVRVLSDLMHHEVDGLGIKELLLRW